MIPKDTAVAVVGAGPIGLITALAYHRLGYRVTIIDKKPLAELLLRAEKSILSRLYAITIGSFQIMEELLGAGVLTPQKFQPINRIFVNDGEAYAFFNPSQIEQPCFGYMIEESDLYGQLFAELQNHPEITQLLGVDALSIEDDIYVQTPRAVAKLIIDGRKFVADLILVASGREPDIIASLPLELITKDYYEKALVFTIRHSGFDHKGLAVESFMSRGPLALLPQSDPHVSSVVWAADSKLIDAFLGLAATAQEELMAEKMPEEYADFSITSEFKSYPLKLSYLRRHYYKNVVFLGDTAHVIHPVAGQGVNLGIRGLRALIGLFRERAYYSTLEALLREYDKARRDDVNKMICGTDLLINIFSNNNVLLKFIRRVGLNIFHELKPLKRKVMRYATGTEQ